MASADMEQKIDSPTITIVKKLVVSIACGIVLFFCCNAIFSFIISFVIYNPNYEIINLIVFFAVLAVCLFLIWKKLKDELLTIITKVSLTFLSLFIVSGICITVYDDFHWGGSSSEARAWLVISVIGMLFICLLFIWRFFKIRIRLIGAICAAAVVMVTSVTIMAPITYENSLYEMKINEGEEIPLYDYMPFREGTLAKSLDESSSLSFQENLPRLDGSTAHYPLYAAFVKATYPEAGYDPAVDYNPYKPAVDYDPYIEDSIVRCSKTVAAFENLLDGTADVIFLMGVSDDQWAQAEARGLELKLTPIGKEAFVFFVNKRNSISDLTVQDIKDIYSGKVTNWNEVGGENDEIRAYLRAKNSGSQTMLEEIMGGVPLFAAPEEDYFDMMKDMYMAVAYKDYKNSLGFSFRYYIGDMIGEDKVKLLSIDGVPPTRENIADGSYPFALDYYAITVEREPETDEDSARMENAEKLIEWILSPQGQALTEMTGYVPLP